MRPAESTWAVPWAGGTTIDSDFGERVAPGSWSFWRTSITAGPWTAAATVSSTATVAEGGGVGGRTAAGGRGEGGGAGGSDTVARGGATTVVAVEAPGADVVMDGVVVD